MGLRVEIKSLREEDIEQILNLERAKLKAQGLDEIYAQMQEWKSLWREESLRHYLPKGWSFAIFDKQTNEIQSYFIAKVIPFFRSYTQVLWIEHLNATSIEQSEALFEVAYRYSREKHLQQIFFQDISWKEFSISGKTPQALNEEFYYMKTTRNED